MRTPVRYETEEGPEKLSSQGKYCGNAVVFKSNAKKIHDEQNTKISQTGFNRTGIKVREIRLSGTSTGWSPVI